MSRQGKTGHEGAVADSTQVDLPFLQRYRWLGGLGLTVVLAGLVGVNYGPEITSQAFEKNRQQIAQLPPAEREQLERNLRAFQQMSPAERNRLLALHEQITERRLEPLVEEYSDWLSTLAPFERQALRNSQEPAARLAVVEEILKEKHEQDEYRLPELIARIIEHGETSFRDLRWLLRLHEDYKFQHPYILTSSQIDTLIDQVFLPQLTIAQQNLFTDSELKRSERILKVLQASMKLLNHPAENWPTEESFRLMEEHGIHLQGGPQSARNTPVGNATPAAPPEEQTAETPGETPLRVMVSGRPIPYDLWKRIAFRRLLVRSLLVSEMQEFERKYPVKDHELLSYFARLDSSAQATLLATPADYQTEALKWHYLWNTHRDKSLISQREYREFVLSEMIPRGIGFGERGGPPAGFRPDGRGPGNRGPGGPDGRGFDRSGSPPAEGRPPGNRPDRSGPPDRPEGPPGNPGPPTVIQ